MFRTVLVANRGEIAVRAFRAAYELGARTVAVFPWEDRNSEHRLKADAAYEIGERGHPVRAYLDPEAIVGAALQAGADAVYPGYGFLSENPLLAEACEREGITFIGPPPAVLHLTGNKATAIAAAREAGVPVLESVAPSADVAEIMRRAEGLQFPVFVKAVAGGGGRGMRRVARPEELQAAVEVAMREAESAFGDPTVFLEQAVIEPRHIEVQILADATGDVIHLFERDCSVQRRHQKVIEIAPAPHLDPALRERICADAVAFARRIGYVNAGTVEFLVDPAGRHVFIEMNPRIQVEHTVTEEVTDVDLVQSQMRIASGETLEGIGLRQSEIRVRGAALQCRITTEDPANGFRPDTGKITAYRSPGGAGCATRRRYDVLRRRGQRPLRLAADQADLSRPRLPVRRGAGPAGRRRVPDPRRGDEHPLPARGSGRPGLQRGRRHDLVHRDPPGAADRSGQCRPRHQAAHLPRRRDGQPAVRRAAGQSRAGDQAAGPGRGRRRATAAREPGSVAGHRS